LPVCIAPQSLCTFSCPPIPLIYTLSLHDALPISVTIRAGELVGLAGLEGQGQDIFLKALAGLYAAPGQVMRVENDQEILIASHEDRKSTRLNSSHVSISYAVFCLKKKKKQHTEEL